MSGLHRCATPLSPTRQSVWYGEFCLFVAEHHPQDAVVELGAVRALLDAFLGSRGLDLPKRSRDVIARRAQFEINLPAKVRIRSYSV